MLRGGKLAAVVLGASYDPAAAALFSAMSVTPDKDRRKLINSTYVGLRSAGLLSLLDVLQVPGAHDAQAGQLNWIKPGSFTLLPINGPNFLADRGYAGDGVQTRLRTQYTPSVNGVNWKQNDASLWEWVVTNVAENTYDCGTLTAPLALIRSRTTSNELRAGINEAAATSYAGGTITTSVGLSGISRTGATTVKAWKNGVQVGATGSTASTGLPATELWVGGGNGTSYSTRRIAMFAAGAGLAGKEMAFYNIMLAYMQGIGVSS